MTGGIAVLEGLIKADSEGSENEGFRRMLAHTLRGLGLARHASGDNAGAVAATRQALELHEGLQEQWSDPYELACIRAELAGLASQPGSGIPPAQAESLADEAVALLFKAASRKSTLSPLSRSEWRPLSTRSRTRRLQALDDGPRDAD